MKEDPPEPAATVPAPVPKPPKVVENGAAAPEKKPSPFPPLPPPPQPFATVNDAKPVPTAPVNPVASPAFRAWTDDARVTGVVSGVSPRAIINGRLVRPGDVVDAAGGIVFDGLDIERKILVFRNQEGAFTTKPY